jgi:hypothetical protein
MPGVALIIAPKAARWFGRRARDFTRTKAGLNVTSAAIAARMVESAPLNTAPMREIARSAAAGARESAPLTPPARHANTTQHNAARPEIAKSSLERQPPVASNQIIHNPVSKDAA